MVIVRLVPSALGAACLLAACVQSMNPCPAGSTGRESEDRCVDMNAVETDAGDGGDVPPDPEQRDAGPDGSEPELDATMEDGSIGDGDAGDAAIDAEVVADSGSDGSAVDGGFEAPDTGSDGGTECSDADVELWKDFHLQPGLVGQIISCASTPSCADGECPLDACVREAAGVAACEECVAAEIACVARECASPCGAMGSDDACRACVCANGCTELFGQCAGAAVADICADCGADSCQNMSVLPPELIMAVLHPVLFAPPVIMMRVTP
jgi:hypothetical protein